jgi:hypothetical protein
LLEAGIARFCGAKNISPTARAWGYRASPMKDSIHVSKENYLKAILEAEAEGRQVIPAMLAHWLEVSAPAVTMALKRLKRDGLVKVGADGIVRPHPGRGAKRPITPRCAITSSSAC